LSAPAAAPATAGATPGASGAKKPERPATTRVTILTGKRMTDLVLPSAAAIETYIDETVAVLAELLEDTPADKLAGFDFTARGAWAFARPGAPPLKLDESLDDATVVDGSLLTLVSVSRTERYRPLVEDVIDAIAVLDESPEFDRAALNRFVGVAIPAVTLALTVISVITWATTGYPLWWAPALAAPGIGLLVGSVVAKSRYKNLGMAESLLVAAFPVLAGAAALAVPLPRDVGSPGAPQFAGGAAAVLLLTLATRGGPRRRAELASFVTIIAVAATAVAIAYGYGAQHWVAPGAIVFGLFIVTNAAKLTVAVARIALPPIPAPGESVGSEELLDPVEAPGAAEEGSSAFQAIMASVPESAVRLTERSRLARELLTGFVSAGTLVLAFGAIALVVRGHFFIHSMLVAGLVTTVCGFRSRLYAERWCAWALLAAVVAIPTGVAAKVSNWYPHDTWLVLSILLAGGIVALVIVGATTGGRRLSPVTKRILELLDGAAIAAVIPLLLWIASVYDLIRNIRL
jgi:type VII secretion integral membrane protein EccD